MRRVEELGDASTSCTSQSGPIHMISFVRCQSPVCKSGRLSCGHVPTSLQRAAQTPVLLPVEVGEDAVLVAQSAVDSGQHRLLGLGGGGESPAEDGAKEKALLEHGGRRISRSLSTVSVRVRRSAESRYWLLLHATGCYCMLLCYWLLCCASCATVAQWILLSYYPTPRTGGRGGQIR